MEDFYEIDKIDAQFYKDLFMAFEERVKEVNESKTIENPKQSLQDLVRVKMNFEKLGDNQKELVNFLSGLFIVELNHL